ncbi:dsRNA-specific ribonuclease [Chrysochromulina ericina virus CeV-01B]|uniref:DsRNA-specific ribonuclease n=1 Tax=Chrysochromulina ericina virus CeV-01B TaxID=3070830 RepID=A0A0N7G7N6_9VIRU|nr:dsRNA-specific ribonuclease [Chrysochromulina ericina virus]ALH23289.1 dsRNA-specific ribonuclease [Chrysochromulina ericina virus CeV-01B]
MTDNEIDYQDPDIQQLPEGLIFNPFNPLNIEITLNDVQSILKNYGVKYNIDNINLYMRAFIHRSYVKRPALENATLDIKVSEKPYNCLALKTKSNERLEFLGDGVLELITKYYLYKRFPKADEGFMTEKKIALVKNEHIGKLAYELKLHKWFILSKHAEEKNTRTNFKKLGCLFEAFIGALFLDVNKISITDEENWFNNIFTTGPGFQMAQIFIESIFEKHVDWVTLIKTDDNYKNIFQVLVQKEFKITPTYLEINHTIESGYEMGVYICLGQEIYETSIKKAINYTEIGSFKNIQGLLEKESKLFIFMGKGVHKIKKKAEQIACEEALKQLE